MTNITDTIAGQIDVNKTLETTGGFFDNLSFTNIFSWLGERATSVSGFVVKKTSEVGLNISGLSLKLLTLVVLCGMLYLFLKIGKRPVKITLSILTILLIISVVVSIFFSV